MQWINKVGILLIALGALSGVTAAQIVKGEEYGNGGDGGGFNFGDGQQFQQQGAIDLGVPGGGHEGGGDKGFYTVEGHHHCLSGSTDNGGCICTDKGDCQIQFGHSMREFLAVVQGIRESGHFRQAEQALQQIRDQGALNLNLQGKPLFNQQQQQNFTGQNPRIIIIPNNPQGPVLNSGNNGY